MHLIYLLAQGRRYRSGLTPRAHLFPRLAGTAVRPRRPMRRTARYARQFHAGIRTRAPHAARPSRTHERDDKMGRTKDGDGIKSNLIVAEVQKRPCLFDTNDVYYSDRSRKERCWDEVCERVVPDWDVMRQFQKLEAVREVQKRWRSIRDSFTKAFRQGKCVLPEQCQPGSRRYQYHMQMSFLLRALQNKKPRYSQDKINANHTTAEVQEKYESFSEVSNSPQHPPPEDLPKADTEKPLDLKTSAETEKPETVDKCNQAAMAQEKPIEMNKPSVEITIDANSILPDDYFDDDKMFMNSLLPLFKKMNDDTRLLCRIEVLKIIRYLLRGETLAESPCVPAGLAVLKPKVDKEEVTTPGNHGKTNGLAVTTRSAGGSRPQRKRKTRSPSPLPFPAKRRGPGRPRKVRPPPSDSEEEQQVRKRCPKLKVAPEPDDDSLSTATSVAQLTMPVFMKMYNLERSKAAQDPPQSMQVSIKTEPVDDPHCS